MALSFNKNNHLLTKAELDRWQNALKKTIDVELWCGLWGVFNGVFNAQES